MQNNIYKCPVCDEALVLTDRSYKCINNHSFDISREGYVNLLLANQKKTKDPGDNAEMVVGRQNFLNLGQYEFLSDAICKISIDHLKQSSSLPFNLIDAGSGEGYYTENLYNQITVSGIDCKVWGVDISKHAAKFSARRSKDLEISVGSVYDLPYQNKSANTVVSVFSPVSPEEFERVLKDDGIIIMVGPQSDHLTSIASLIYDEVKPHAGNDDVLLESNKFKLIDQLNIKQTIHLDNNTDIKNLLMMTPYYWHIPLAKQNVFNEINELDTVGSFRISIYQKS